MDLTPHRPLGTVQLVSKINSNTRKEVIHITTDYTAWDDAQCVNALIALRTRRAHAGIMPSRFVSKINKAGYAISTTEYRLLESAPLRGLEHVRKGLLDFADRAFDPMPVVNQVPTVRRTTETLARHRMAQGLSYEQVADAVTGMGYPITRDEYRTLEQGTTKRVSIDVILFAAMHLQIPGPELFPQLEWHN